MSGTQTHSGVPLPDDPDPRAATAAVTWAVAFTAGLSMDACAAAYDELNVDETRTCPRYYDLGDPSGWNSDCTTTGRGTSYLGELIRWSDLRWLVEERLRASFLEPYGPTVAAGWTPTATYTGTASGVGLDGEADVVSPDAAWSFVGQGWSLTGEDRGLRLRHSDVQGECTYSSPTGAPWIDERHFVWVSALQLWSDGSDARFTFVDGSIGGVPAEPFETVSFVGITWSTGSGGCEREPDGTIEVRDRDGRRWPLVFSAEACDGCADLVQLDGTVVDQVCPDLGPLREPFVSAGDR